MSRRHCTRAESSRLNEVPETVGELLRADMEVAIDVPDHQGAADEAHAERVGKATGDDLEFACGNDPIKQAIATDGRGGFDVVIPLARIAGKQLATQLAEARRRVGQCAGLSWQATDRWRGRQGAVGGHAQHALSARRGFVATSEPATDDAVALTRD